MNILPWQESRKEVNSSSGDAQIWSASFEAEDCSCFTPFLSEDEKYRAARQKNMTVTHQKIISRGILRLLLSRYTGLDPKELIFENGPFGKPSLVDQINSEIGFNLAHSGDMLLIAIGKVKRIGIDVEKIEEKRDFKRISLMVFSDEEQLTLSRSSNPIHDFYGLWTAKEAVLKATGLGFSYPVNKFSVVIDNKIPYLSLIPEEINGGDPYSLSAFIPKDGYSAALATSP